MQQEPFGYGPYEPPIEHRGRPAVILWYRTYAAIAALAYGAGLAGWGWMTFAGREGVIPPPGVVGVVAAVLAAFFAVATLVPHRPWGWTVGLVAIALGLVSCAGLLAIPLLVFWVKPETKAAFRRL